MNEIQIKEIQGKLKDIIEYFDTFCKKNDIDYYLNGGSALGAIRHNDFIPWDDDFDVIMTRNNYIKFLSLAQTQLDLSRFHLQMENSDEWPLHFSKIRMNGTTYLEKDNENLIMHKGFFIDVFCLYNLSNNLIIRYLQYFLARLLVANALSIKGYKTSNRLKKLTIFFAKKLIKDKVKDIMFKIIKNNENEKTKFIGDIFCIGTYNKLVYPRDYIGTPRLVKFSKYQLPVFEQVEKYLLNKFGKKYMEIPSEKVKRKYPSHVIFYDTEMDYKNYSSKHLQE